MNIPQSPPSKKQKRSGPKVKEVHGEFQHPITISEDDYISKLPVDCIYSAFSFLNQLDLDRIAPASQTINNFIKLTRPTVPRSSMYTNVELNHVGMDQFTQKLSNNKKDDDLEFYVSKQGKPLSFSEHIDRIRHNNEVKRNPPKYGTDLDTPPQSMIKNITFAAQRFQLKNILLQNVIIDDYFPFDHIKLWNSDSLTTKRIEPNSWSRIGLSTVLPESRIKHLCFQYGDMDNEFFISDEFIRTMSQNVTNPTLEVVKDENFFDSVDSFQRSDCDEEMFTLDEETVDALVLYRTAKLPYVRFPSEHVFMAALTKRLRRRIRGEWEFVEAEITREYVAKTLDSEFQLADDDDEDVFTITTKRWNQKTVMTIEFDDDDKTPLMYINFYEF